MTVRILMVGGTGLVGSRLTERLLRGGDVRLESLVRSPSLPVERRIDFEQLLADPSAVAAEPADVAVSCLGTTLHAAGSPERFRRVDHDYVVAFARLARRVGAKHFVLMSSVGAGGRGLYLSVKGETEAAIKALAFARVDLVRPSLLLGPRTTRRPAEAWAQRLAPMVDPFLVGPLANYAPLAADVVGAAMERLVRASAPGLYEHHVPALRTLARD